MSQITEQPKNPSFSPGIHTIHVTTLGRTLNLKQSDEELIHNKGAIKFRDAYQLVIQSGEAWLFN